MVWKHGCIVVASFFTLERKQIHFTVMIGGPDSARGSREFKACFEAAKRLVVASQQNSAQTTNVTAALTPAINTPLSHIPVPVPTTCSMTPAAETSNTPAMVAVPPDDPTLTVEPIRNPTLKPPNSQPGVAAPQSVNSAAGLQPGKLDPSLRSC